LSRRFACSPTPFVGEAFAIGWAAGEVVRRFAWLGCGAGVGGVFIWLFGIANPVIEDWLSRIDIVALLEKIDIARLLFWVAMACGVWAYLRPRLPRWRLAEKIAKRLTQAKPAVSPAGQAIIEALFGRSALLRALVVFNAIFAVQTALDAAYLWGGVALPDGMSYASYAHRGAYPLIVTALLAAAFVLVSMRPGAATSSDRLSVAWSISGSGRMSGWCCRPS
jgi:hypothetical protein